MKLSEAIRLGSMLKPQAFGREVTTVDVARPGDVLSLGYREATCAFAAALDAQPIAVEKADPSRPSESLRPGVSQGTGYVMVVPPEWEVLYRVVICPVCLGDSKRSVFQQIAHLNDEHRWTREHIAEWVQGVEDFIRLTIPALTVRRAATKGEVPS